MYYVYLTYKMKIFDSYGLKIEWDDLKELCDFIAKLEWIERKYYNVKI